MQILSIGNGAPQTSVLKTKSTIDALDSLTGVDVYIGVGGVYSLSAAEASVDAHKGPVSANWIRLYTGTGDYNGSNERGTKLEKVVTTTDISTVHDIGFYTAWSPEWHSNSNTVRLYQINFTLGSDGDKSFNNSVTASFPVNAETFTTQPMIQFCQFNREDFAVLAGTFNWSTLKDIRIEFLGSNGTVGAASGLFAPRGYVQGLQINNYTKPTVIISHDDGPLGVHTLAMAALAEQGFKSTQFVVPDDADGGGSAMTVTQLQEMYAAGHDIGLHATSSGSTLNTLTGAQVTAEIAAGLAWLSTHGMTRGQHIMSYPQGIINDSASAITFDSFVDAGIIVGRLTRDYHDQGNWSSADWNDTDKNNGNMKMHGIFVDADNLPQDVMPAALQRVERYGGILFLIYHNVLASGAATTAINIADYKISLAMLKDHERRGLLQVLRGSDVFGTDGSLLI